MKLNWLTKFCLVAAGLLLGGVFIVQAAGFVSYEDNNKIIIWDPVKMTGKGLKMSAAGVNDLEDVPDGVIKIEDKDLYVRNFMGFDCPNYPQSTSCTTTLGNIGGNSFLTIDTVKGENLYLNANGGIDLNLQGDGLKIQGKIIMPGGTNSPSLFVVDDDDMPSPNSTVTSSVFVDDLHTAYLGGLNNLDIPGLKFEEAAYFDPKRMIFLDLTPTN
ncbi:MAG: hypothetical protein GF365_00655 [Candidatus Buchananbacteria bacterium]|nr:hypothetical protein [Candidatus Buchananbacteria bacterium]